MATKKYSRLQKMKQAILQYLYKKFFSNFGVFPDYPEETFKQESMPIIEQLLQIDGMKIDRAYRICDGGPCFRYIQTAMLHIGGEPKEHIAISWELQDDGGQPYPVIDITKFQHHNKDLRDGVAIFGIRSIYPHQIPNLKDIINQVRNHPIKP